MNNTNKKVEYTEEEKALFTANNTRVNFWVEKALIKEFDKIAKEKGVSRKDALIKLIGKFVAKNKKDGE